MTPLAVMLVVVASVGYALGARLQHAGVRDTIGAQRLRLRGLPRLVRNGQWLLGVGSQGGAALLHAGALGLAPLSVVQPIGVLALPITVLFTVRRGGRDPSPRLVLSVSCVTLGLALFVLLAAGTATPTAVGGREQLWATELVGGGVLVLSVLGFVVRSRLRCVAFAAGCAVAYGYVSLLVRALLQELSGGLMSVNPLLIGGIVVAMLVGGWLLQHAYASGPSDLVMACLLVIDPLVAVGLGIGLLGEADLVGTETALGELLCAAVACAGVFALAWSQPPPQEQQPALAAPGGKDLATLSSTDRPDGSIS